MKSRKLGKSGLEVSTIGLGCMGMDHAYGPCANRKEMISLIREAVTLGCNFFDTAPVYGKRNEELLGEALVSIRGTVYIATKFGITGQTIVNNRPENILDSSKNSIKKQVLGSLQCLQTDYIDLYYQHRIDPKVEPEEVANTMKELIDKGIIKAWGVSNAPIDYIKRAHAVCPIAAIENQYSMMWREPEKELFELCEQLNIAFVAYSPLGNGFLSGQYTKNTTYQDGDFRKFMGRFRPEVIYKNQDLLDVIAEIANTKNATSAQIVLAWELAQKPYIIPIPGTTKLHRLKENLGSVNIQLTKEELKYINNALSNIDIDETHF